MAKQKSLKSISVFISLVLRHKPEAAGITLDRNGWADVSALLKGVSGAGYPLDMQTLEEIVATDEKGRYSFNENKTKIRANQGHSVNVDVELTEAEPPEYLWHGTGMKSKDAICKQGLLPQSRLYVHLSADAETAVKVGSRHGKPYIFCVKAGEMYRAGFVFYRSVNGVWLTKQVPPEYLAGVDKTGGYE